MYLRRNNERQIIDVEIVQRFCEDCLGKKNVVSTEREQKKGEKLQQSQYITLHSCASLKWYLGI